MIQEHEYFRILKCCMENSPTAVMNADDNVPVENYNEPTILYAIGWGHANGTDGDKVRAQEMLLRAFSLSTSRFLRESCGWALVDAGRLELALDCFRQLQIAATESWERTYFARILEDPRFVGMDRS